MYYHYINHAYIDEFGNSNGIFYKRDYRAKIDNLSKYKIGEEINFGYGVSRGNKSRVVIKGMIIFWWNLVSVRIYIMNFLVIGK